MERSEWVDLRGTDRKLYGRLNPVTLELQLIRGDRDMYFDLVSTAQTRQPVVTRVGHKGQDCRPKENPTG